MIEELLSDLRWVAVYSLLTYLVGLLVFIYAKLAAYGWMLGCRRFELDYHKSPDERTLKDGDKKQA